VKFGAKLRNYGVGATMASVLEEAHRAVEAGFDSLWLSDHIAMPERTSSWYPYGDAGRVDWDLQQPWLEPVVALAALAATTRRPRLGTAVLVAPLREPIGFAKQFACVTQLSGGRLVLGVGDGWLREELELFGADFEGRRDRTDWIIDVCREVWSGALVEHRPDGDRRFFTTPAPVHSVPVFLGGMSESAFRRIASRGYGWLPLYRGAGAADDVRRGLERIAGLRREFGGSSPARTEVILNAGHAAEIAPELGALAAAGVGEVLIDGEFGEDDGPRRALERARDAVTTASNV
jgi:probable F420-dependent oxidoreductase